MKNIILGLFVLTLAGCQTVPIAQKMPDCSEGVDLNISQACPPVVPLTPGSTYQMGLSQRISNDSGLKTCRIKAQELQQALQNCHNTVMKVNAGLDAK